MALTLRRAREIAGFSPTDFAKAIGISVAHMSNLEAGRANPSHVVALRIAEVLRESRMRGLAVEDIAFSCADTAA